MIARRCLGLAAVVAVLATSVAGCNESGSGSDGPKDAPRVTVSKPLAQSVRQHETFTGRIAPVESVDILARVSGYLDKVFFSEGQEVKKGDKLFEIDRRPYEAEKDKAEGNVREAAAQLKLMKSILQRSIKQFNVNALSAEEYSKAIADEAKAAAAVEVAQAGLKTATLNLGFTIVTSPIDGRISKFNITPGNLVVTDKTLLTTVVSMDPMYAYFAVDELTVQRIREMARKGTFKSVQSGAIVPVELRLSSEQGYPHKGSINFVDVRVDPSTGTLPVRGEFPNKDRALVPGYFCRVRVTIGAPYDALLVPERALLSDQGQKYLLLVDGKDVVQYRPVEVGLLQDGLRAIRGGLKADDRVIINGLQRVRPGLSVSPQPGAIVAEPGRAASPAAADREKQ